MRSALFWLFRLSVLLVLATCAAPVLPPTRAACHVQRRTDLKLTVARDFLLVPVTLDRARVLLVVDTGAETSTVTPEAAARLKLRHDGGHATLVGVAGALRSESVRLRRLDLGGIVWPEPSLSVAALPSFPGVEPPVAGLLGADLLARYDVELDIPGRRMALYSVTDCGQYAPAGETGAVPLSRTASGLVFVSAVVDGQPVRALLDTGARTTLLSRRTAARLGVSGDMLADDPTRSGVGIGLADVTVHRHRFNEVRLGPVVARRMLVDVADLGLPGVDMLLGMDFLAAHQVWISYATGRLFLR
jgi:predicted aspartyl protease